MAKNINTAHNDSTFERLKAIKEANGGSWAQNVEEAFEALAREQGIDVEEVGAEP